MRWYTEMKLGQLEKQVERDCQDQKLYLLKPQVTGHNKMKLMKEWKIQPVVRSVQKY
jgi:hypothetical protein